MKNKKTIISIISIVFIILIISGIIYSLPRKFNKEFSGIIYRLGDSENAENINANFEGYLSKGIFRGDKFEGVIEVGDKELSKINLILDVSGMGAVLHYYDETTKEYVAYGSIQSDNIKKMFTISIFEKGGWTSSDGLMISAPASNRREALEISSRLMKDILEKEELK